MNKEIPIPKTLPTTCKDLLTPMSLQTKSIEQVVKEAYTQGAVDMFLVFKSEQKQNGCGVRVNSEEGT